jgi:septal ring factor EnvC (AmiA/AmiB activator)
MQPTPNEPRNGDPESIPQNGDPESIPQTLAPMVAAVDSEPERRRLSDYLGDVSRLEAELAAEQKRNQELQAEVQYQRRRIEREEEARLQLMQLLDNSQRLLGNAQRHAQQVLGSNEAEAFTQGLTSGPEAFSEQAPSAEAGVPSTRKPRWRWWGRR